MTSLEQPQESPPESIDFRKYPIGTIVNMETRGGSRYTMKIEAINPEKSDTAQVSVEAHLMRGGKTKHVSPVSMEVSFTHIGDTLMVAGTSEPLKNPKYVAQLNFPESPDEKSVDKGFIDTAHEKATELMRKVA